MIFWTRFQEIAIKEREKKHNITKKENRKELDF